MQQASPLEALHSELAAAGVFAPVTRYYVALGFGLGVVHVVAYTVLLAMPGLGIRSISVLLTVFTSVQLALLAHDARHGAIARSRRSRQLVGQLGMSVVNGYSFTYFMATHLAHHAHPNEPARDPDMRPEVFSVHAPWPPGRRGILRVARQYQAWLLPCGLLLWAFALRGNGLVYALRHAGAARADLVAIMLHAGLWLAVPTALLGPGTAPMTARNFGGSGLVAFLAGGLDSQIEHHIVPQIPNLRLRQARAVVREFCARRDLPYREAGYFAIWRDVLAHFHRIGRTAADPKRGSR